MENSDHQQHIYTTKQSSVKPVSDRQEPVSQDTYLPIEIISDVLSRLSVPTVLRFRMVCKAWSNLTRTQAFIRQHLERFHKNETNHGSQTLRCNGNTISYSSEGHSRSVNVDFKTQMCCYISQHCHGLVVCTMYIDDAVDHAMGILNPAVDDELIMLPDEGKTRRRSFNACLCHDPPSNKYKVIRLFDCIDDDDDDENKMGVEVLTLGDDSWRQLGQVPLLSAFDRHDRINIHGAIHWITSKTKILSFKIGNDNIDLIEYPAWEGSSPETDYDYLIEYEGCLCVVRPYWPPLKLKFFVMEDYANRVWKEHEIDLEQMVDPPIPKGHGMYSAVYSVIGAHNGKLILDNGKSVDIYYYDPETRSFEKYDGTRSRRPSYKESLISARTILFGET